MTKAKEVTIICLICLATLLVALLMISRFAPALLGVGVDMQLVQSDDRVAPFYDSVIRLEDLQAKSFLLPDPILKSRAKPFVPADSSVGPHDLLGLRNDRIPNRADIVTIGDSQTYGNNALLAYNWPSHLKRLLDMDNRHFEHYSMSTGSWGAIQYYEIASNAVVLGPRLLIVAFYTGNDPLDTFSLAYGAERWAHYRIDPNLSASDAPRLQFPPPKSEQWKVEFKDGITTTFTPTIRWKNSEKTKVIDTAYKIMAQVVQDIAKMVEPFGTEVIFTIVPTKEMVYSKKIEEEKLADIPESFNNLVRDETARIQQLQEAMERAGKNAHYVDITSPMIDRATESIRLYPDNMNGHPIDAGYRTIADALKEKTSSLLGESINGFAYLESPFYQGRVFVKGRALWFAPTPENTDHSQLPVINMSEGSRYMPQGHVNEMVIELNRTSALINEGQANSN